MAAKVIKLTDNSGVTLMPLTDAKYVQITYAGVTKSVHDAILDINLTYTNSGITLSGAGTGAVRILGGTYTTADGNTTAKTITINHRRDLCNTIGYFGPKVGSTLVDGSSFYVPRINVNNAGHIVWAGNISYSINTNKVQYVSSNTSSNYPVLFASQATPTNNSRYTVSYDSAPASGIRYNPNSNTLTVPTVSATNLTLTNVPSNLQAKLTFDSIPTENSNNPVTSGGIYSTIVQNEQVTAAGLSVLNSRLTTVEDSLSSLNTDVYVSKTGTNIVDTSQEIKWASHNGALHIDNTSLGWTGGAVNVGGLVTTYGAATFGRSGISIYDELSNGGNYFVTSFPTGWTYVNIGHSTNGVSIKAGHNVGYIYAASDITAAKFYEQSDERLKSNINNICNIDDISLYEFDMNGSHMYGFVAQDLAQAYPELVKTTHDENKEIVDTLSVDYNSALTLTITKLYKKIKELEQRIIELENK